MASLESVVDDAMVAAIGNIQATLAAAIEGFANSRTSEQLLQFARSFGTPPTDAAMLDVHNEIGALMQQATLNSYRQAKRKMRHAIYSPDPRGDNRMKSGALERALASQGLWEASASGISFGIWDHLDGQARQWARLNYGIEGFSSGSHYRFPVRFSNLGAIEFNYDVGPRPTFKLPKGFWIDGGERGGWGDGSTGAFYPYGKKQVTPIKQGARLGGFHFLDRGVEKFFEEMPRRYSRLIAASSYTTGRPVGISAAGYRTRGGVERKTFRATQSSVRRYGG